MTERLIVPVPVTARAEALNQDERHARLDEPPGRQAVGAVPAWAVAVAHLLRLAGQVEQGGRLAQAAGAGEALLVALRGARRSVAQELPAERVAERLAGSQAFLADTFGPGCRPRQPAVAGKPHHVEARAETAGALEGSVVPRRR